MGAHHKGRVWQHLEGSGRAQGLKEAGRGGGDPVAHLPYLHHNTF